MAELRISRHRAMEKHEIRRKMRHLRQELDPAEKCRMDEAVCKRLLEMLEELWRFDQSGNRRAVYCYASYGTEIDTLGLIQKLWELGVSVAVPRVEDAGEGRMEFYWITAMKDLASGYQGILEPAGSCQKADEPTAPVITPGLAFTRNGARLGYGGGYYDRFFAREPEHLRIAVSYPFQLLEQLPTEDTDLKICRIVTDGEICECCENGMRFEPDRRNGKQGECYGID